jgi:hypothetical protein
MMNVTRAPHTPDARPTVRHVLAGRAARVNVISAIKTRPLCSPLQALVELAKLRNGENMTPTSRPKENDASANITKRMQELEDWRGETLAHVRRLIHEADPDVLEEWKWVKPTNPGVPVWSHDGGICTGEAYKQAVKLTFFRGASIKDPKKLFNSSLEGNVRRAIDVHQGETINEAAFKQLIRAAVAANSDALAVRAAKKK